MKLSLTPTKPQDGEKFPHLSVSAELPRDDITLDELVELLRSVALAAGYSPVQVNEQLGEP